MVHPPPNYFRASRKRRLDFRNLLYLGSLKLLTTVLPQLLIHVLEHLAHIAGEPVHGRVPVAACVLLKRSKNDRQNGLPLLRHQADNVLVVPQEEGTLRHLGSPRRLLHT